ncbi:MULTISPECIES: ATP-binding cassette domain-containing protein [Chryseobacterium]|uniref:Molybdate transport system ATP-binding protein n=3 Tax=Chryseobacterium TaxID=59732 RepID=A0AAX2ILU0_9FLAO|nr:MULTISPECIES: ATP-binding cassette domain-containing protein [Chryseobacterium]AZA60140.1 ATP-binding cassette domain-containing protein [Chryseobacterium indoltheticum]AZB29658.1 ABC transporter ATP-binding protein [Chryseobacterium balustinum]MCD0477871.1 ATP-binding cassette domain-containing protein [Chryseobacterium sp. LC2016-29]SFZ93199.1 molybdate transport system ATP-binding protein [Chryseobacterium limigenitum]SKB92519.1 molybdate transport system ATP-binding protein [Chryseobact
MIELNIKHQIFTSSGSKFLEVSEVIEKGSFIHISGDSGIGKTTFFKILAGIITPNFGIIKVNNSILLDTENRIFLSPQKRNISIMFQNYALFPNMTVKQNIAFAQKDKNLEIIDYYLEKFNLKILENVFPSKLSGGQQQRVALARALAQNAEIILLDEPLSAVDASLRHSMMEEILKINQDKDSTIFMISHNQGEFQNVSFKNLIIS